MGCAVRFEFSRKSSRFPINLAALVRLTHKKTAHVAGTLNVPGKGD
jgi:hypothetical protein